MTAAAAGRHPNLGMVPGLRDTMPMEQLASVFAQTAFNRAFEFEVARAFDQKAIRAPVYLSVGQEHIPASIASAHRNWLIFAQHRAHSYYLSFGGDPVALIDELLHRETGCARGMGGSASLQDPRIGMFGHSGLMGDNVPIAVGAALMSKKPTLAVVGDAALEEDYVFGAMGFAVTKRAPVLFICEDNDLSILTPVATRRTWSMVDVASGLGMPAVDIADDPWLIAHYASLFVPRLPCFINIRTCRHLWHAGTGSDGAPEWNRYELFKETLAPMIGPDRLAEMEDRARDRAASLWLQQLQKPSATSLATI
jgi:acetoin:2,6-dichlorophenolindophenol oxidoreductase subunit alpha